MKKLCAGGAFLGAMLAALPAAANPKPWGLNMTEGVTATAQTAYDMHMLMLEICIVIGVIVFGMMFFAMFKFRKSAGAKADVNFTHSTLLEALWTTIPIVILVAMAYPATKKLIFMTDTRDSQLTIKVTGYQWKWRYEVMEYHGKPVPVNFVSSLAFDSNKARHLGSNIDPNTVPNYLLDVDRPLKLPTHTKIRFLFTADDVIHAWIKIGRAHV